MTPVDQRVFAHSESDAGDCLSACLATVLDVPLDEVPVFVAEQDWFGSLTSWLDGRGFALVFLQFSAGSWPWIPPSGLPLVVGGPSPRGAFGHAVVAEWGDDGMRVVHDPHPSRAGLGGDLNRVYVLVPRAA